MTPAEHCPICLSAARRSHTHEDGEQTITTWRCGSCAHQWQTSYLTAAYGESDEPGDWDEASGW